MSGDDHVGVQVLTSSSARQLLFQLGGAARLPEALGRVLRDERVGVGWLRGSGVLEDVRIRVGAAERALHGPVHAVVLEGRIDRADGEVTCGLRAVLARETDTGLETLAGEIVGARIAALDVMVMALDDLRDAGQPAAAKPVPVEPKAVPVEPKAVPVEPKAVPVEPKAVPAVTRPAPVEAEPPSVRTSSAPPPSAPDAPKPAPRPSPTFSAPMAMPPRPVRPVVEEEDELYPEAGDVVEHFAFGRCEVVKSDGDRLHLRLGKDGRVKEIALEMLRVTALETEPGAEGRRFKLERKL